MSFDYDVFLSHSYKDKPVVREIAARLKKDGVRVWFDEEQIKSGDSIPAKIEEGLQHSRVLVLCMSANAFGSDWAQLEAGTFRFRDPLNKARRFVPLRLDDTEIKGSLAQFLYIDWRPKAREQGYHKLLEASTRQVWLNKETELFAAEDLKQTLQAVRNMSALGFDHGPFLYSFPSFLGKPCTHVSARAAGYPDIPEALIEPTREKLMAYGIRPRGSAIESYLLGQIEEYLKEQTKGSASNMFQTKIGLEGIEWHAPKFGRDLILRIYPMSHWTERYFNRRMLDPKLNDKRLTDIRDECRMEILSLKDEIKFPCPSALFAEVSVVTADQKLIVVKKRPEKSPMARSGFPFSCTVEEGLLWKSFRAGSVDFHGTIVFCLRDELAVESSEIESILFNGIALEHSHLNTAMVGTAKLNIAAKEVCSRVLSDKTDARDFDDCVGIPLEEVPCRLFGGQARNNEWYNKWHPTARLRAWLALVNSFGHAETRKLLEISS